MKRLAKKRRQIELYNKGAGGWVARRLDHAITAVFPGWGRRRIEARAREAGGRYAAAQFSRVYEKRQSGSADSDLLGDLATLREQSRALARDDGHAKAITKTMIDSVIGGGLMVQARATPEETGMTPTQSQEWNDACEMLFRDWAVNFADATQVQTWYGLQRLAFRHFVVDGEAFGHRVLLDTERDREFTGRMLSTAVEVIDPDRIESPRKFDRRTERMRSGVELGRNGQPITYWVLPEHPDDALRFNQQPRPIQRVKSGFRNMLHLYDRERAGQTRGAPMFSAALKLFDHTENYLESEIIAARTAAMISLFIKKSVATDIPGIEFDEQEEAYHEELSAGSIEYLNEGEEIQPFTPQRPGNTFDPFLTRILRAIAASFGLPYELLVKDFGRMNYSSARVALLEARRGFLCLMGLVNHTWNQPTYENVITEGYIRGLLPQQDEFFERRTAFLRTRWIHAPWGWVDPEKEIGASTLAIEAGLSTLANEAIGNGQDWEEVALQRARELVRLRELEEQNDLPAGSLSGGKAGSTSEPDAPEEDAEDDDDSNQEDDQEQETETEDEPEEAALA